MSKDSDDYDSESLLERAKRTADKRAESLIWATKTFATSLPKTPNFLTELAKRREREKRVVPKKK